MDSYETVAAPQPARMVIKDAVFPNYTQESIMSNHTVRDLGLEDEQSMTRYPNARLIPDHTRFIRSMRETDLASMTSRCEASPPPSAPRQPLRSDRIKVIRSGSFTTREDEVILRTVRRHEMTHGVDVSESGTRQPLWSNIGKVLSRTASQCKVRYMECLNTEVKKGKWSEEEDRALWRGIDLYGQQWREVVRFIPGRTQRQCRTRWVNMSLSGRCNKSPQQNQQHPTPASQERHPQVPFVVDSQHPELWESTWFPARQN